MRLPKARVFIYIMCLTAMMDVGARLAFEQPEKQQKTNHLAAYFNSKETPDLMVLGSSVALGSSFHSDAVAGYVNGKRKQGDTDYIGAYYLKKLIKAKTGLDLNCMTAASVGAMASDSWLTVSKAIEFKKAPQVIVYEFVSRDFFDASVPELGSTPTFKKLASCHPAQGGNGLPKPIRAAIDGILCSPIATTGSIILSDTKCLTDPERFKFAVDSLASVTSFTYRNRADLKDWLTEKVCSLLNRKATLRESLTQQMIEQKKKNPFAALNGQNDSGKSFDTRPQERRYENEIVYFEKLVKLCHDNNIKLIVVNMPVRSDYPPKVPDGLKKRVPGEIFALAQAHGADVIDMQSTKQFQDKDFLDLIHLNETGCVKFVDLLGEDLSHDRKVAGLTPRTY